MQMDVAGRSENFLTDTGCYLLYPDLLLQSLLPAAAAAVAAKLLQSCPTLCNPRPVPFWVLQEKQLQKHSPEHFVAGVDKYFPTSFWWSLSVLLAYWEETSPCLRNLAAIAVLIEDVLKLSLEGKLFLLATK